MSWKLDKNRVKRRTLFIDDSTVIPISYQISNLSFTSRNNVQVVLFHLRLKDINMEKQQIGF